MLIVFIFLGQAINIKKIIHKRKEKVTQKLVKFTGKLFYVQNKILIISS